MLARRRADDPPTPTPSASDAPPFAGLLRGWGRELAGEGPRPRWRAAVSAARSSKWSAALGALWLVRLAVDSALAASTAARRMPLRQLSGIYSCAWAVMFYARHSREAGEAFALMADVSEQLEQRGRPRTRVLLAARARSVRRVAAFYMFLWLTQLAGITHTIFTGGDSAVAAALSQLPHGAALNLLVNLLHTAAMLIAVLAYYTMLGDLFASFGSCSGLYRALGRECEGPRWCGERDLRSLSALHARLLDAARRLRFVFADVLAHCLAAVLILPLLGTVEILVAPQDVDSFTVATFGAIATNFVPVCLTGQELEDASTSLPSRLYSGAWLEEAPPARAVRVKLMQGAGRRAHVAVGGLGSLNASTCLGVVNRWFSYLNVFINMHLR